MDGHFEGSSTEKQANHRTGKEVIKGDRCTYIFLQPAPTVDWCDAALVTIDILPEVVLLDIFEFYADEELIEGWHTLVHVCRKWRNVAFGSPRRLVLRLCCQAGTPVKDKLDVWPLLPIVIQDYGGVRNVDNIVAALEHKNRICKIDLISLPSSQLEKVLAVMQQPFPALTSLWLGLQEQDETVPVAPASFLGGSAPCLQNLWLFRIPFFRLPELLLSATHLVKLTLSDIPHSGYISPRAMVTCLSALTRLKSLHIEFESPSSPDPRRRRPPPPTRTLLPVLTAFFFKGVNEYLEDFVARIDAPLLKFLDITFFHQEIFDTPRLEQFINRTPKFKAHDEAHVVFYDWGVSVKFPQTSDGMLRLAISSQLLYLQLSSLVQVCSLSLPRAFIPAVEHLRIYTFGDIFWTWQDETENSRWLEFLHPFTAVKDLYMSYGVTLYIAPALRELVGERVMEVIPALESLFLEEPLPSGDVQESIGLLVTTRQHVSHPIAVSRWERKEKVV
jgi:hypothetical protein